MVEGIIALIGIILMLITLPGTVELLLLSTGAIIYRKKEFVPFKHHLTKKTIVVIPAHNEEKYLGETIDSLRKSRSTIDIVVVVDNCSDQTMAIAKEKGVRTIERVNFTERGKPFALRLAFDILKKESYDRLIIVDADSLVSENFVEEIEKGFEGGADFIQTRYDVKNPEHSLRHRFMHLAFLGFNFLRPLGRSKLGLSCGLLGNGFGLTTRILKEVPFQQTSLVEDLSYHIEIVKKGYKAHFIPSASVFGEIPSGFSGAVTQRSRWEGGRFTLLKQEFSNLATDIYHGKFRLIEPFLDLLSLPLAYQMCLLLILLALPPLFFKTYALIGIASIFCHLVTAIFLGGSLKDLKLLFLSPFYIIWKVFFLIRFIPRMVKGQAWEKTNRD